jgi:hypothetical protein
MLGNDLNRRVPILKLRYYLARFSTLAVLTPQRDASLRHMPPGQVFMDDGLHERAGLILAASGLDQRGTGVPDGVPGRDVHNIFVNTNHGNCVSLGERRSNNRDVGVGGVLGHVHNRWYRTQWCER